MSSRFFSRDEATLYNGAPFGRMVRWSVRRYTALLFLFFFSRDEATLYKRVSVRWLVGWLVTLSFFGLLGATNAVYTAPLLVTCFSHPGDLRFMLSDVFCFNFGVHHRPSLPRAKLRSALALTLRGPCPKGP